VIQTFLSTWAALYLALAGIYLGFSLILLRINHTAFGGARRIQSQPQSRGGLPAAEQRRHALLSLGGVALLLGAGITLNRQGIALYPHLELTWLSGLGGLLLSMLLYDTWFYWMHRWLHTPWLFRHVHLLHHKVRTPLPWTTNSETLPDGLLLNLYWLLAALLLPIPLEILVAHRLWDMAMGVLGHSGHEYGGVFVLPPSPLVGITHHDQHHQYTKCNFAVHFTWWDRLMGTLHPEHDPVVRAKALPKSH
jgi:lathosterol oxidase